MSSTNRSKSAWGTARPMAFRFHPFFAGHFTPISRNCSRDHPPAFDRPLSINLPSRTTVSLIGAFRLGSLFASTAHQKHPHRDFSQAVFVELPAQETCLGTQSGYPYPRCTCIAPACHGWVFPPDHAPDLAVQFLGAIRGPFPTEHGQAGSAAVTRRSCVATSLLGKSRTDAVSLSRVSHRLPGHFSDRTPDATPVYPSATSAAITHGIGSQPVAFPASGGHSRSRSPRGSPL